MGLSEPPVAQNEEGVRRTYNQRGKILPGGIVHSSDAS